MQLFYANSEMPGAHTIEGMGGIREVYNDMLHSKDDIFLLRTSFDAALGNAEEGFLRSFREQRAKNGITTYALTPDYPEARKYAQDGTDQKMLFDRIFMPSDAYTGKVEIDVYGNKVAMIAFGETEMATVISSPAIAEALRQILKMLRDYYNLTLGVGGKTYRYFSVYDFKRNEVQFASDTLYTGDYQSYNNLNLKIFDNYIDIYSASLKQKLRI